MKVVYNSPNRSHHYPYALALHKGNSLHAFISGVSRLSSRSPFPEINNKLVRKDFWQNIFLGCVKLKFPRFITNSINLKSKNAIDAASYQFARNADLFLFYNGCGLNTINKLKGSSVITVCECVNTHVGFQMDILEKEHALCNLGFHRDYEREYDKRIAEYEAADFLLCPSDFVKQSFLSKGISEKKIIINNYGMPNFDVIENAEVDEDVFRILYVGQIIPRKGIRYLIEAFNKFEHPRKELWLVGAIGKISGIENIKIPDNVLLKGVLRGDDLINAYQKASVFAQPSIEEGLSLVIGEALSFGLPIIATENTGANELFNDGEAGYFVPIRNPHAITEKLSLLAQDFEIRKKLSLNAKNIAQQLNGWEASGRALVNKLESLL